MNDVLNMIQSVLDRPALCNSSGIANDIANKLRNYKCSGPLIQLLQSSNDDIINVGIWIASELGLLSQDIIDYVLFHRRHPILRIRYYVLDVVQACRITEYSMLKAVVQSLYDTEPIIRIKAMNILYHLPVQWFSYIPSEFKHELNNETYNLLERIVSSQCDIHSISIKHIFAKENPIGRSLIVLFLVKYYDIHDITVRSVVDFIATDSDEYDEFISEIVKEKRE